MTTVSVEQLSTDPHPTFHRLRAKAPLAWLPALDAWVVTGHERAIEVMLDPETFTVDDPRFSTEQVIGPSMLSLDGPEHRRHRDPFAPSFRAARIRAVETLARSEARRLATDFSTRGAGDLRAQVAAPLAISLMSELLDLDGVDRGDILSWYRNIVDAVHVVTEGGEVPESGRRSFTELANAVKAGSANSRLLSPIEREGELSPDEIASNVAVLLFGGIVTAESSTAIAFRYLLDDPDLAGQVDADRSLLEPFAEETFRLEPSAGAIDRFATRDVRIGESRVDAGQLVRVSLTAANRDPAVFPDPDRLDVSRANSRRNVTFARGPHACLGIHLARLEIVAAVEALLDILPGLEGRGLAPVEGLVFRSPATVMATLS
ncbi:MAG: cytochrome P450 [Acidimicrobiia bacterium]